MLTMPSITTLRGTFSRAERWDGIYFIDLPGQREKDAIWRMYLEKFGLATSQPRPNDRDWTGAEIRSCCRLAALLDVPASSLGPAVEHRGERDWRCSAAEFEQYLGAVANAASYADHFQLGDQR